jgi:hypothetical protein
VSVSFVEWITNRSWYEYGEIAYAIVGALFTVNSIGFLIKDIEKRLAEKGTEVRLRELSHHRQLQLGAILCVAAILVGTVWPMILGGLVIGCLEKTSDAYLTRRRQQNGHRKEDSE